MKKSRWHLEGVGYEVFDENGRPRMVRATRIINPNGAVHASCPTWLGALRKLNKIRRGLRLND